jgi:hypothetical protein
MHIFIHKFIYTYRWDYLEATKKGWIPTDFKKIETMALISDACMLQVANDHKNDEIYNIKHLLILSFLTSIITYIIIILIKNYVYGKRYQYQNINGSDIHQSQINPNFSENDFSVAKFYEYFGRNKDRLGVNGVEMEGVTR